MRYYIAKIIKGNMHRLHNDIGDFKLAYQMLEGMQIVEKRNNNKTSLGKWALHVNDNEVIYQIVME